ncbi:hypothetical protein LguiA_030943 [Lonicera macranthoides]
MVQLYNEVQSTCRIIAAMRSSVCYRARATHVSGQNPGSIPSSSCCSALASVVESQPQCLCVFLNAGSFYGIPFDPQLARALPAACNVQTPPATSGKHALLVMCINECESHVRELLKHMGTRMQLET